MLFILGPGRSLFVKTIFRPCLRVSEGYQIWPVWRISVWRFFGVLAGIDCLSGGESGFDGCVEAALLKDRVAWIDAVCNRHVAVVFKERVI